LNVKAQQEQPNGRSGTLNKVRENSSSKRVSLTSCNLDLENRELTLRDDILATLSSTTGGTGRMHESFDPDHPEDFTRPWFSWADAMFCELALRYADISFSTR
jgi:meiotically up-regulated gene 157 (Mug157) protein